MPISVWGTPILRLIGRSCHAVTSVRGTKKTPTHSPTKYLYLKEKKTSEADTNQPAVLLEAHTSNPKHLGLTLGHEPSRRGEVLSRVHPRAAEEDLLRHGDEPYSHLERLR